MANKNTNRVIVDFDDEAIKNLDALKKRIGAKTRTGLVRRALMLLEITEEKERDGYKLQFNKGDHTTEMAFLHGRF
jgi:hypothetical protein